MNGNNIIKVSLTNLTEIKHDLGRNVTEVKFSDNHGWVYTETRTYAKQDTISTRYETKFEFDGRESAYSPSNTLSPLATPSNSSSAIRHTSFSSNFSMTASAASFTFGNSIPK